MAKRKTRKTRKTRRTYVMSVYAVLLFAVLAVGARVLPRQDGDCLELVRRGLVFMHKLARIELGTGAAQEVVVAQIVLALSLLDALHGRDADGDGLVEAAGPGVPVGLLRGHRHVL